MDHACSAPCGDRLLHGPTGVGSLRKAGCAMDDGRPQPVEAGCAIDDERPQTQTA